MQKRKPVRKWTACSTCHQLVFVNGHTDNHVCPTAAVAKKEAELDMIIDDELTSWDYDLKVFWKSRDVKFTQHLLDTGQYD
jgi:creatinine amidohydrolase/Fe(II)-dependent formamide hydrolase-like protein